MINDNLEFALELKKTLEEIEQFLLVKNLVYGNSVFKPVRIFSKAGLTEQIKVRIDDKLSRLSNQLREDSEDTLLDLIGYLIILKIASR